MVMRHLLVIGAIVVAASATADACPVRYEELTAVEREALEAKLSEIEAILEAQDREREAPSYGLELVGALLCLGSLIAFRRPRPADPI